MDDESETQKGETLAQCHSASKRQSHDLNHRKSGFRVCNKLPSNNLLLDGEAGNVHNHVNDHITHFVLNIEIVLYTVDASEVWSWETVLQVATCTGYRTFRIQISNPNLQRQRGFISDII